MNETKKLRDTTVSAVIALLAERYPKCFSVYHGRRRPLKLKIHLDIQAALDGAITPAELHRALGIYCSNPAYLGHTRTGAWRLDLDGNPTGIVTADEEAHAKATLASIRAKKEVRTATAKAAAQTQLTIPTQPPKRLSLADLKAAALARKTGLNMHNN
jgi:ProP effector